MKDSHGIKKLYESARRGYEGGGRICLEISILRLYRGTVCKKKKLNLEKNQT